MGIGNLRSSSLSSYWLSGSTPFYSLGEENLKKFFFWVYKPVWWQRCVINDQVFWLPLLLFIFQRMLLLCYSGSSISVHAKWLGWLKKSTVSWAPSSEILIWQVWHLGPRIYILNKYPLRWRWHLCHIVRRVVCPTRSWSTWMLYSQGVKSRKLWNQDLHTLFNMVLMYGFHVAENEVADST